MARRTEEPDRRQKIGALCIDIAGTALPHFTDLERRDKLARLLIDLSRLLIEEATHAAAEAVRDGRVRRIG